MTGRVLDRTAIVDMTRAGGSVYGRALLLTAVDHGITLTTSTTALLDAWATLPASDRALLELFLDAPAVEVEVLDPVAAASAGLRAHNCPVAGRDAGAAHTVDLARRLGYPIVTDYPDALRTIDPTVTVERLP